MVCGGGEQRSRLPASALLGRAFWQGDGADRSRQGLAGREAQVVGGGTSPPVSHYQLLASLASLPPCLQLRCLRARQSLHETRLALKAAGKGEKFSISSISSKRFPSHLVTAVFRKITGLMGLLLGTIRGAVLVGMGNSGHWFWDLGPFFLCC